MTAPTMTATRAAATTPEATTAQASAPATIADIAATAAAASIQITAAQAAAGAAAEQAQELVKVRAEALFASYVQRSEEVTPETVRTAIAATICRHGSQGCTALVAQEYGEHPETAFGRMRWALATVRQAY